MTAFAFILFLLYISMVFQAFRLIKKNQNLIEKIESLEEENALSYLPLNEEV